MEKIRLIEGSFRCLKFGWLSLAPVFGIAFSFAAITSYVRLFGISRDWNPARAYLYSGAALALLSLLLHGLLAAFLIVAYLH
jgi:hypothetical protein